MKKYFNTLWFRVVWSFFWIQVGTGTFMCLFTWVAMHMQPWRHLALLPVGLLVSFMVISVLVGTAISFIVVNFAINPVRELARAIQAVTEGDLTVKLDSSRCKGEIGRLFEDFNQMAAELNSTELLHSDFISNVSHEFKTPLASISGYATLLQDDTLTPEERAEYTEAIIRSTKDLSQMTGNILNLSHLDNQTVISERQFYRVDEQIRQSILRMEPLWTEKNLSINPELDSITWYGNMELTAHIWNNLLDNAVKFTPPGGEINISARVQGDRLVVSYQDSGIGMTPEVQAHIFDKFYQGDPSHRKKGNGLGLALVRRIVTLYGGSIEVSSYPELGSTFTVSLPLDAPAQASHTSS